ncbi:MAG: hypothetical protein J6U54_08910 [Clostridiales bacterium]|nr:hypothetical protein [Clostridiales bacterium]
MLPIVVSSEEKFDEDTNTFIPAMKPRTLRLEHSLISVSKWEAIYHKPFLSTDKDLNMIKTYAKCMSLDPNVDDVVFENLSADNINDISKYIEDNCTATWFSDHQPAQKGGRMNGEVITAEIVYYWMIKMEIPVEFQKWHLNRLLTLIRVISIKDDPKGGKMPKMTNAQRSALNKARQAKYHTRG